MDRSGPRLPSPWWVLLPGVLLALAGARAVTAEMDRAREDARERARQGADRVARALEGLVEEFLAPLPAENGALDASRVEDVTRHLYPQLVLRTDGGRFVIAAPEDVPEAVRERDAGLAADVRARIGQESDPSVAEALLTAAAEAVETRAVGADLRLDAARTALAAGDSLTAIEQAGQVLALPESVRDHDRRGLAAAHVLADALDDPDRVLAGTEPPEWVVDVVQLVAEDPWGMEDAERAALTARLLSSLGERYAEADAALARIEHTRSRVRRLEEAGRGTDLMTWSGTSSFGMVVLRRVQLRAGGRTTPAWVGGGIPFFTSLRRVDAEMDSVRNDLGVEVSWTSRSGDPGFDRVRPSLRAQQVVVTAGIGLGFTVTADIPPYDRVPPPAVALGAAVLVATLTLIVGAFGLSRAARRQAQLAEERRTFLDHVAHEVRTPAAALLALSEELGRGHVAPERQAAYHEHLLTESRRLADLVEETLDLARLEGGRLIARREPTDLRDVVRDAVEAARPGEGRVLLTLPQDEVPVEVDRAAVRRAVRNLVDNALKHGDAPQAVEVTLAHDGVLTVRDHGRGIPAGHIARVFERFHRVPSPTHEVKGVGLGLALVREVADVHGGCVAVENAPGGGALFTLRLPLAKGGRA